MYGLPINFDANIFLGRQIESITYASNVIVISLDLGITFSVESSLDYLPVGVESNLTDAFPLTSTRLITFIGNVIIKAIIVEQKDIMLFFEGNSWIAIKDDSKYYESYKIKIGETEIVV
jgi:hypothetical protein